MPLSPGQIEALGNLARKSAGEDVGWINISHARALTELGLAERNAGGWRITPAGLAAWKAGGAPTPPQQPLTEIFPR